MSSRRRFSERQVIETLIRTGTEVRCYRTKEIISLDTVNQLEREHVIPLALGGADDPTNAAYSLASAHKIQTNGKPHTTYGSDKHAIAKARRIASGGKKKRGAKIKSRPFPQGKRSFKGKTNART